RFARQEVLSRHISTWDQYVFALSVILLQRDGQSLDWACALCFPAEESMLFRANVTVFSLPAPSAFGALS
ncbi:hypothetical protein O5202_26585, partial [Escherichia coli]|nr:hypothetical protein [Escherichia coli]